MKKKQKDEIRVKAETDFIEIAKKFIKDIYKQNIKDLEYTFESFFIDSDLEGPDKEFQRSACKNLCLGKMINKHKYKRNT